MARRKFRAVYRRKDGIDMWVRSRTRKQAITADSIDKAVLLARLVLANTANGWSEYNLVKVVELVTVWAESK